MDYTTASNATLENLIQQKDGDAICELAERCLYGTNSTEINYTRAFNLFHKGEKLGIARAYKGLGDMYYNGFGTAQNKTLAEEYYKRGNINHDVLQKKKEEDNTAQSSSQSVQNTDIPKDIPIVPTPLINTADISQLLISAEQDKDTGNISLARQKLSKATLDIQKAKRSGVTVLGTTSIISLEMTVNWLLGAISFAEQNYTEMETFFAFPGVLEKYPRATYLCSVAHQLSSAAEHIIEQDLKNMLQATQNAEISNNDKGELYAQIAELYLAGFGHLGKDNIQQAYAYYEEAANLGNAIAIEQLPKFSKSILGKIKYIG